MPVFLNQADRALHIAKVPNQTNWLTIHLPDGYSRKEPVYIGGGAFGDVVRTKAADGTGKPLELAIKKFKKHLETVRNAQLCYREIKLLQMLDHPNITRIVDLYATAQAAVDLDATYLVMEYVGPSLDKIIKAHKDKTKTDFELTMERIPSIIYDTLSALKYMKAAQVFHRDLKPSNIATNHVKSVLIDFGLSRNLDDAHTDGNKIGTNNYRAPEMVLWKEGNYGREVDIWAVGCILAELITWIPMFKAIDKNMCMLSIELFGPISDGFIEQAKEREGKMLTEWNNNPKRTDVKEFFAGESKVTDFSIQKDVLALDFITACLHFDPNTRIAVDDAVNHEFVRDQARRYENQTDYNNVIPVSYKDDKERTMDEWKETIFNEIKHFPAREDTPRP